ncbi:MAG: hypothetical protein ISS70_25400 [Phycisphaerae bacterium]|nr:hypothetical protein [Phycisphaerae bacterium]
MKRISISAIALLVALAGVAEARQVYDYGYGYSSNRYRVRWSIYNHGLISGDLYYSPYAFGPGRSGLVDGRTRYSPYAFGHGHCGLVVDDGGTYSGYSPAYHYARHSIRLSGAGHGHANQVRGQKSYGEMIEARKARTIDLAQARQQKSAIRASNGKEIIAGYLKGRNIDFKVTRILCVEGRIVSVDFLLNDGNTILKYWNPAEMQSLAQPQGRRRRLYDKYVESWISFCAEHLKAGGKIHQIVSSDADEILAKLPLCPDLNGDEEVYALATEPRP